MARGTDLRFIDETLRLARRAGGRTCPNPMVGAVIVQDGRVVGRGFHRRAGLPHAEIEAFKAARGSVVGATLYVSLEPCAHHGRTPPCVDAIIRAGIKRVVCCTRDPNPKVNGRGIATLRHAGLTVRVGLRSSEARALNAEFFRLHATQRPRLAPNTVSRSGRAAKPRLGKSARHETARPSRKRADRVRGGRAPAG